MTTASAAMRGPLRKRESNLWQREANDWYVEPEWCSARLFQIEKFQGEIKDPACGSGRIVKSALAAGLEARGTDLIDRGFGLANVDFLETNSRAANIVSNPPFGIAEAFVAHALELAERKVAILLPANWVQGQKRSRWLRTTPLYRVYFICPRPSMPPGHVIAEGGKPGNGTTDYCWMVWLRGFEGAPSLHWLYRDDHQAAA
jgi:hypothetical protein